METGSDEVGVVDVAVAVAGVVVAGAASAKVQKIYKGLIRSTLPA